jgi:hypothetical protein
VVLAALAALTALAGCSHGSNRSTLGAGALASAASALGNGAQRTGTQPSGAPSSASGSGPSAAPSAGAGNPGPSPNAGGPSAGAPSNGPTLASRFPSPAGMQPPTATAATAVGCQPLTGGGWQATFVVTLAGGEQWAVLPEHGPATRTGDDQWTIVIQEGAGGPVSIPLTKVLVGGGSPFRSAYVPLGPGVAATAACPS